MRIKKYRNKITVGAIIAAALIFTLCIGGGIKSKPNNPIGYSDTIQLPVSKPKANADTDGTEKTDNPDVPLMENSETADNAREHGAPQAVTEDNGYKQAEDKDSTVNPEPIDPQNTVISDKELYCSITVRCDTILNNINLLPAEKHGLLPDNGIILDEGNAMFYEGESVFNLLLREMKKNKIHFEYTSVPLYNSVYIEGINNIYEIDCGELSGWMYKVNGWFPNYGCSRYRLNEGDRVEVLYSCDLGRDVGGDYSSMNGR